MFGNTNNKMSGVKEKRKGRISLLHSWVPDLRPQKKAISFTIWSS
jgi:hypothetical protein